MFEPAWSTRTEEDDPGAPFFNDTTKYVVSGTLTEATWLTRGGTPRLFGDGVQHKFELAARDSYDNGVVYLAYRAAA